MPGITTIPDSSFKAAWRARSSLVPGLMSKDPHLSIHGPQVLHICRILQPLELKWAEAEHSVAVEQKTRLQEALLVFWV